jgi:hypothetical protein
MYGESLTHRSKRNANSLCLMLSPNMQSPFIGQITIPRSTYAELSRIPIDQGSATHTIPAILQAESAESQLRQRSDEAAATLHRSRSESETSFLFVSQRRDCRASLCDCLQPSSITDSLCYEDVSIVSLIRSWLTYALDIQEATFHKSSTAPEPEAC